MLNETKSEGNVPTPATTTTQVQSSTPTVEIVRQQRFEVGPRYTDLKFVGEGAYGMYIITTNCYILERDFYSQQQIVKNKIYAI